MNTALVFNLVGVILLFSSGFMLVPLLTSFFYKGDDLTAFGLSFLATSLAGLLLYFSTRSKKKMAKNRRISFLSNRPMTLFHIIRLLICSF